MELEDAFDLADEIDWTDGQSARIDAYREAADRLERGETGRAVFLGHLGEELTLAGRFDEAREALRDAIDDPGPTEVDARLRLLTLELKAGTDDADTLLHAFLREAKRDELNDAYYEWIGEELEEAGRLQEALRWFTMPLRDTDPTDLDNLPFLALDGRSRVRRELGLPEDSYDLAHQRSRALLLEELDIDDLDELDFDQP